MQFKAIDVETANSDMASICQVGIATFSNGKLIDVWSSLVDPEDYFDGFNVSIHGISERMVRGKPRFPEIVGQLRNSLESDICVSHTAFDRVSIGRAFVKYKITPLSLIWLDSARVARRTWKEIAWKGYGLANICKKIGYEFKHHDALEDAKAAGHVLLAAIEQSQIDLDAWRRRVKHPIDPTNSSSSAYIHRDGNPEGDLFGEVIVFTGALKILRHEAADQAAEMGCQVAPNVSKKTTILVVGDQDILRLAGYEKSTKHRKAEELISKGCAIRIIRESDFEALVSDANAIAPHLHPVTRH